MRPPWEAYGSEQLVQGMHLKDSGEQLGLDVEI